MKKLKLTEKIEFVMRKNKRISQRNAPRKRTEYDKDFKKRNA
jgi:hypothetical protein